MSSLPVQYLELEGGKLAYSLSGPDGATLIVLSHGIADSRFAYRFIVPELVKAGYRVANLDIRGCGDSDPTWPAYTRTDIAKDMLALVRKLSPDRPAIIIGHSISGGAATVAAALEPTSVKAIVEIAPFTREMSVGLADIWRTGTLRLIGAVMFASPKFWLSYLEAAMPGERRPADWEEAQQKMVNKLKDPAYGAAFKTMGFGAPTDAAAQLKNVKCPTLIIEGSLDCDWANAKKEGEAIVAAIPGGVAELAMVDGAGHYPHFQYPEETLAAILPFLKRVA
jgi:pimeloyl-ACP methyl ester carboxylesterase